MSIVNYLPAFVSEEREYQVLYDKEHVAFLLDSEEIINILYHDFLKKHIEENPEDYKNRKIYLKCNGVNKEVVEQEETVIKTKYILE